MQERHVIKIWHKGLWLIFDIYWRGKKIDYQTVKTCHTKQRALKEQFAFEYARRQNGKYAELFKRMSVLQSSKNKSNLRRKRVPASAPKRAQQNKLDAKG